MRRNELDLASQPVRNTITNPAMVTKTSGTDTVLTNYIANPTFEYATHNTGGIGGNQASFTSSGIVTDKAHSGTKSFKRATCTVAGQASLKPLTNPLTSMKVNKGQKISWSFWVYSTVAGNISPYWEGAKVSDGSYTGGGSAQVAIEANAWTYVTGTSTLVFDAYVHGAGGYGLAVNVGDSVWFDDFCLTQTDSPVEYFNGDTPAENGYTYAWTGTPHYSASVRKASAAIVRTNLVANPTFKGGTLANIRTNYATNPSFRANSGSTIEIRRNLATNPSYESTTGTPTVRTNLIQYPNFEAVSSVQAIRTNLCLNPRGVNAFGSYSGAATITPNVAVTGHPEGITTANRVAYDTGSSNYGVILLNPLTSGTTYTVSAWVYHESAGANQQGLAQAGVTSQPTPPAIVVGQWQRISWTFTASGTSHVGYRTTTTTGPTSFLITGVLIEARPDLGKFFDGATPVQQNLSVNPSFATNTTGWTAVSATLTRVTNQGGDGHSCEITQTVAGGTRQSAVNLLGTMYNPGTYTLSFDFKGTDATFTDVRVFLYDSVAIASRAVATTPLIKDGNFNRYTFTITADGTFDRAYAEVQGVAIPVGAKAWVDRVQLERSNTASPIYYEGTGDFSYAWGGTANASTSSQSATTFSGWSQLATSYRSIMDPKMGTYSGAVGTLGRNGDGIWPSFDMDVTAGRTYTFSAWIKATSVHSLTAGFRWKDSGFVNIGTDTNVTLTSQLVVGSWVLVTATATAPALATKLQLMLRVYETHTPTTFYIDGAICVESMTPVPYFDGSTAASGDFTYAWSGTVNASTSLQRGVGVTENAVLNSVPVSSTEWKVSGTKSMRLVPHFTHINDTFCAVSGDTGALRLGMLAGRTYTVSATIRLSAPLTGTLSARSRKIVFFHKSPADQFHIETASAQAANVAGETRLSVTVTIPDTATEAFIRLYNGASAGNGDVWWDNLLVEEATALRPYFDGTVPDHDNLAKTAAVAASGITTHATDVAFGGSTWTRVTTTAGASQSLTRQYVDLSSLRNGEVYTTAVTVANDHPTVSVTLFFDWADSGSQSFVIAPGETRRIKTSSVRSTGYTDIYRFSDLHIAQHATESRSILFKDWLIELGTTSGEYYTGTGDFSYAWTGTANASTSVQRASAITGNSAGRSSSTGFIDSRHFTYQSTDGTGKKLARWLSPSGTPSSNWRTVNVQSMNYAGIVAGSTYTIIMRYRSSGWGAGQTFTISMKDSTSANPVIGDDTARALNTDWTEYRRTFTALISGLTTTTLYITLPVVPQAATDGVFDISEWALVEGAYNGPFFDGSTAASPSLSYGWSGTADASISYEKGTALTTGTYTVESKLATYVSSSGTYIAYVKEPNGGGGRSFVPASSVGQLITFTSGKKYTIKMRGRKFNSATGYRFAGATTQEMPLTTSMASHTVTFTASSTSVLYMEHPSGSNDAGTEWEYLGIYEEGDPLVYFDGDTSGFDGLTHRWTGTPYASQSQQIGSAVSALTSESLVRRWALPDGAMRVINISGVANSVFTEAGSTTEGRTHTVLFRAKLVGSLTTMRIYGLNNAPSFTLTSSYAWYRATGVATSNRLWLSTDTAPAGSGYDMSHLMVVEGTYTGGYVDGASYGARWDGAAHASTSLALPTSLESIAGKPLFMSTVTGNTALSPSALPDTAARTIYTIVDNVADVPIAGQAISLSYGINTLNDTIPNKYIIMRQQGSYGQINSLLTRRTGGGGAIIHSLPSSGRHILIGGLNENGYLFSGYDKTSLVIDNLVMSIPHERIIIEANSAYHTHVATYIYAGFHNDAMRAEMVKLLSLKHNVPL